MKIYKLPLQQISDEENIGEALILWYSQCFYELIKVKLYYCDRKPLLSCSLNPGREGNVHANSCHSSLDLGL